MDIKADEIESIKVIGELNNSEVKMMRLYGGFHVAVGLKKKGQKNPEVLAAGSHPALVSHQLTKEYSDDFKPKLCKSESEQFPTVEEVTNRLSPDTLGFGVEAYILEKNNKIEFIFSKYGVDLIKYEGVIENNSLSITNHTATLTNYPNKPNTVFKDFVDMMDNKCKEKGIVKINK